MINYLYASLLSVDSSIAINVLGWSFTLGLTFGYIRERLNYLDRRVDRIERWIDEQ